MLSNVEVTSSGRWKDFRQSIEEQVPLRFKIPFKHSRQMNLSLIENGLKELDYFIFCKNLSKIVMWKSKNPINIINWNSDASSSCNVPETL